MKIDAVEASASDKPRGFQSFRGGRGGRVQGPLTCFRCQKQGHRAAVCRAPVLRRVLLQNRPSTWPPPMRAYSPEELDAAVQMQVNCRGNVGAAKAAVFRRDMFLATRDSDDDTYGEYLRALNAVPYRQEQREDDAFRNVKVAQAVIALPPSVDDERWAPNAVAFAVSILVFMLNLHWWSHVGSCFKASRASTPGQCPYRFPRTRAASTSCTSAGVELARRVPIEYVNGYNACMMLAFKSNHDVQVLIGGLKALLRIYNTTKYVTKRQNLVDSVTAVALGAFKRRELREQQNQSSQADRSVIGRRRVASMVFALTNRREIAGPLAAHYLLRGSCAYMSATCTTLPLYDVMRLLIQHDTHSCNLVEVREGGSNVTFRAASFFDDYLFRPVSLDHKCLYEFVMTCFRRKQSESTATSDLFLTGHPLYSTHSIRHHQIEAVQVITGVRMPYIDSETPPELVAKRAQCALVLFKPFRSVLDLVSDPASETAWSDAYFQWESTRTSFVCEIMANMDDYYRASKRAQEDEESGSNELDDEADSDELLGTRNNVDGAIGNMPCNSEARIGSGRTDDFCHVFAADDDDTITGDGSTLPIFPTAKTGSLLSSFVHQELLGMTAEHVGELQEWVKNSATDEAEASLSDRSRNERPADVIELIQRALESTRQHVAFSLIATALLRRFQQQERTNAHNSADYRASDFESRLRDDQLIMFLGGAGGTGKSRVIDAVNAFCSGWHRSNTMVKAALTGKAATLIGGRTLASFLVRLEHAIKEEKFTPLDLLIIDEISMMTKAEWLKLERDAIGN